MPACSHFSFEDTSTVDCYQRAPRKWPLVPQERGEELTLCSLCKPPLGCFETLVAPFQREGSPPNPPASVWVQPDTREPLLSGSPPQAKGHPACGSITHGGGSPVPEPSLLWCLLFLEEKTKCVLSSLICAAICSLFFQDYLRDHRSWSRAPRRQPALLRRALVSKNYGYNGEILASKRMRYNLRASNNPTAGESTQLC